MHRPSPVPRIAAVCSLVAWLAVPMAPAVSSAENAEEEEPAAEPAVEPAAPEPAAGESTAQDEAEMPAPAPVERNWSDQAISNANVAVDLLVLRPFAAVTLGAGAVLFVPAALLTAPNGSESIKDAYQRFVREPGEYLISRPLGEF
jgi:hypothetical protein